MKFPAPNASKDVLPEYRELTDACRDELIAELSDAPCRDLLISHFKRGKMLRCRLLFAATAAVGGYPAAVKSGAVAVELLHGASLIHDDIVDHAAERRGLPALHTVVSSEIAIILGDYLVFRSFATLCKNQGVHQERNMVEAVRVLSGYAEQCCQGQIDEQTRSSATCSEREYLTLARNKTASQFAAAAQLGAILVGASKEDVDALGAYGLALGTAFQIQDDALDLLGNADTLGKPIGNSLALGRPNLAVIYLWEYGSEAARAKYRQMERSRAPLEEFAQLLVEEGMVELACAMQKQHSDQALETLERLSRPEGRAALAAFNRYLSSWGLSQMRGRNAPASSTCRDSL